MERGTEYGLEQVYNVIDSRYISKKPLIATTNLTPEQLRNPEDVPLARIYGRLLEMFPFLRHFQTPFRGGKSLDMTHSLYHIKADFTPQVSQKRVRYNTKVGYNFVLNLIKKEDFGYRQIRDIKVSDERHPHSVFVFST